MTEEKTTKTKIKKTASWSNIKFLTDDAKNLIEELVKNNKDSCAICDENQTKILSEGYIGFAKNKKANIRFIVARGLTILGFARRPVGSKPEFQEDIKRVNFLSDGRITLNLTDKNNFVK